MLIHKNNNKINKLKIIKLINKKILNLIKMKFNNNKYYNKIQVIYQKIHKNKKIIIMKIN